MGISTPDMWTITYVSTETAPFSRSCLYALLAQSRARNLRLGITGLLLYHNGNFVQTIEGPHAGVVDVYASICADARHDGVTQIASKRIVVRQFANWSMAFRDLNFHGPLEPDGFSDQLNEPGPPDIPAGKVTRLRTILEHFRK